MKDGIILVWKYNGMIVRRHIRMIRGKMCSFGVWYLVEENRGDEAFFIGKNQNA